MKDFCQQAELNKLGEGASLGPTVVVFQVRIEKIRRIISGNSKKMICYVFQSQETQHTDVLAKAGAEEALRQRFSSLKQVKKDILVA